MGPPACPASGGPTSGAPPTISARRGGLARSTSSRRSVTSKGVRPPCKPDPAPSLRPNSVGSRIRARRIRETRATALPTAPVPTSRAETVRKSPSQRRFWNTVTGTLRAAAASFIRITSEVVASAGLSTTTATPTSIACKARSRWVWLGDVITTRSNCDRSAQISTGDDISRLSGNRAETRARRSGSAVTTAR